MEEALRSAKSFFNNTPDLAGAIRKLVEENADARKQLEAAAAEVVNGIRVAKFEMSVDPGFARNMALLLQKKAENLVLVGAYEFGGKPNLLAMYSNDLVAKGKNAGKDIREAAKLIQGGGGGQPGLATAGGRDTANLPAALEKLIELATA
jgi:alanyl-tRNA synthetase